MNQDITGRGNKWHLFIYKVPGEPSSKRIYLWRELNRLGALYLQQAACLLPARPGLLEKLEQLKSRVEEFAGTAYLFPNLNLDPGQEAQIIEQFKEMRNKEYQEIIKEINKYLAELEKEVRIQNFSPAEIEEEEAELEKIERWYQRARERDWYNAPLGEQVASLIDEARVALARFTTLTYGALKEREIN
ncbi:MAG: hypothetical protein PWQ98_1052 [Moorella sp. (in: firmicutes)]|jgi:DNA-binding transcriptional regulator PaaX|nr:hypothetical protein [Moorella sp. (in: firmicutes)]